MTTTAAPAPASQRLEHFPVSFFATVMGTAGLAIAWHKAHLVLGAPVVVGEAILDPATALFAVLLLLYAAKWLRHPGAVMRRPGTPSGSISLPRFPSACCCSPSAGAAANPGSHARSGPPGRSCTSPSR